MTNTQVTARGWFEPVNPVPTAPPEPTPLYDELMPAAEFAAMLTRQLPGVVVTVAEIDHENCSWCATDGQVTTVRIYGQPEANDPGWPLDSAETCRRCCRRAIKQARIEQDLNSDRDIRVEVSN
ncbi:hypothetical protein [Amycolatopsis sp. H20-H5]|uniref:hypothetical protein n=1 Tax=Amycolatopsis sp. H20-H5 TaxID=3046309 RepID=UPI002DBB5E2B|nr:hypothetical protein [Amycolatopsis sp. H20-H5]MEC3977872.1 hypothetical protein [Amycolatopsis sp. H20-H5]